MAEENTQNISEEITVKKEKNPKRVEQGKKLAEWNRKNKKAVLEVQDELVQDVHAQDVRAQDVRAQKYWIIGGALVIIGAALYFTNYKQEVSQDVAPQPVASQQVAPQQEPTLEEADPFAMD